jgi:hypothetical protein
MYGYTDKKENQNFLIYKEIQNGAVANSYMTHGLLIYEEIFEQFPIYIRKSFPYILGKFYLIFYQCNRSNCY